MNLITSLLSNQAVLVGTVVFILVFFNSLMTLIKKVLDRFAAKSAADGIVTKICAVLGKVIEFLTANSTALPDSAKKELADASQKAGQ